jgi:hypothetical protein
MPNTLRTEPVMYPLVDNPTHRLEYGTFEQLRHAVEGTFEDLNQIQSWMIYDERDENWGDDADIDGDERTFLLCILMPSKSQTIVWMTHAFARDTVQAWLDSYVRARTMRWYGWAD